MRRDLVFLLLARQITQHFPSLQGARPNRRVHACVMRDVAPVELLLRGVPIWLAVPLRWFLSIIMLEPIGIRKHLSPDACIIIGICLVCKHFHSKK